MTDNDARREAVDKAEREFDHLNASPNGNEAWARRIIGNAFDTGQAHGNEYGESAKRLRDVVVRLGKVPGFVTEYGGEGHFISSFEMKCILALAQPKEADDEAER